MRHSASARAVPDPVADRAEVTLRRMGLQDLTFVVDAHLAHFGDSFFARLGSNFLARYYRTFLDGPTAVAVIAESAGAPCGYLTGVLHTRRHRTLLLRYHGPGLAARGCVAMLRHPRAGLTFVATRLPRYARGLRQGLRPTAPSRGAPTQPSASSSPGDTAVLTYVVVAEPRRHRGVGALLVNHFLDEATIAGCTTAALVTVADPNGAAAFYEARGWTRRDSVTTAEGKLLWRYTLNLQTDITG